MWRVRRSVCSLPYKCCAAPLTGCFCPALQVEASCNATRLARQADMLVDTVPSILTALDLTIAAEAAALLALDWSISRFILY